MTRKTILAAGLILLGAAVFVAADQATPPGDVPWFDLENCAFCKFLTKDPQLMHNMKWDTRDLTNGAAVITVVKPEFRKSYMEANKGMEALAKKMETGEVNPMEVPMCGSCQHYGKLMEMGAKFESVQSDLADLVLITSDKPEVVTEIKTYAQRNRDEMAKMEKMEKSEKAPKPEKEKKPQ
jgi:hypothetical protein